MALPGGHEYQNLQRGEGKSGAFISRWYENFNFPTMTQADMPFVIININHIRGKLRRAIGLIVEQIRFWRICTC